MRLAHEEIILFPDLHRIDSELLDRHMHPVTHPASFVHMSLRAMTEFADELILPLKLLGGRYHIF